MAPCRDMSKLTPEHGQIRYCVPAEGSGICESQGYQHTWHVVGTRVLTSERDPLAHTTLLPLLLWLTLGAGIQIPAARASRGVGIVHDVP